jgi:hypothetical protein
MKLSDGLFEGKPRRGPSPEIKYSELIVDNACTCSLRPETSTCWCCRTCTRYRLRPRCGWWRPARARRQHGRPPRLQPSTALLLISPARLGEPHRVDAIRRVPRCSRTSASGMPPERLHRFRLPAGAESTPPHRRRRRQRSTREFTTDAGSGATDNTREGQTLCELSSPFPPPARCSCRVRRQRRSAEFRGPGLTLTTTASPMALKSRPSTLNRSPTDFAQAAMDQRPRQRGELRVDQAIPTSRDAHHRRSTALAGSIFPARARERESVPRPPNS